MYNPRNAITKDGFDIIVDLDKLDLDYTPEIFPPAWKPTKILKPYDSISKLYMDIETTGLDPMVCRVTFIGLKDECGVYKIFTNRDEEALLNEFMRWFYNNTPEALILHNGFNFDLPFLIKRFSKYQINHSFRMAEKTSTITASSFNGKPIEYTPVYWNSISIIDTFQQISIWDKSAAKLEGYGLKNSVIALKLREDRRLELSNAEIQECWKNGDLGQIETYLRYDLDDTELLANFLLPIVWYQMAYVPNLSFQQLATASPALKAQKVHQELIGGCPEADEPMDFLGGGVELLLPGLNHDVAKIDVASLYPSLMLRYGLCSKKDPQHKFLGWIKYLVDERLRLKELAKNGDKVANHQQNAMKILVNGSYGFMGTGFYTYNDYEAAALVTAYGRKILALMHDTIVECGDKPIECLTDDTEIITFTGVRKISEIVDLPVNVLTNDFSYRPVVFTKRGRSEVYDLELSSGTSKRWHVKATSNHQFELLDGGFIKVSDMSNSTKLKRFPSFRPDDKCQEYYAGVCHGIIYGDGNFNKSNSSKSSGVRNCYTLQLCHIKSELVDFFEFSTLHDLTASWGDNTVTPSTKHYIWTKSDYDNKSLPSDDCSISYRLGFIRGLLATDGCCTAKEGCVDISGDDETITWVMNQSPTVGLSPSRRNIGNKAGRTTIIRNRECTQKKDNHRVFFERSAVIVDDLLNPKHRKNFINKPPRNSNSFDIVSITLLKETTDVFCCTEPVTGTFILSNKLVSHNCDTDGIYYSSSNPDKTFDKVSSVMPDGISLELEMKNCGIYAPKAKNYIIIHTETGKMTVKGMFRKRNRYPLDNEFPIEYIRKYFTDGKLEADNYFLNITETLEYGDFDLNKLTITRRIGKAEKTLVDLGIGKTGEISSFWYAEDVRFHKRTGKPLKSLPIPTNQLKYWPHYYVDRVVACRDDILFDHTKPVAPVAPTEPVENALDGLLF